MSHPTAVTEVALTPAPELAILLLLPLAGAILNGFRSLFAASRGREANNPLTGWLAVGAAAGAFGFAAMAFFRLLALPAGSALGFELFSWIETGTLHVTAALIFDPLSAVMAMFVTFTAALIHLYSVGYMKGDPGYTRYFSYLNLFLFSMLVLILADSLPLLFVGWEGVGLCSFLLISFWFEDPAKAEAGKKAFLANRVGDAAFLLGIFAVFAVTGTVTLREIQGASGLFVESTATLAALCFFIGATGKSAQIPLYVWLPDAMAGPTPVSALIHAATMVTAGVYLVARLHFLYALAPIAGTVVAIVGTLTALLAASIAVAQDDIKKVLAYSTISQLGYMFLAVGVGAYVAGIFHVMTHAFFKALLFLGAGSVIHALHHQQDIRSMGGLLKRLPVTGFTFLAAWLAISGVPPFSGFFSKDEILFEALATPNSVWPFLPTLLYVVALATALLTAFYMTRLVVLVFFGPFRGGEEAEHHLHESPWTMTVPLVLLAIFSTIAGFVGVPHVLGGHHRLEAFLAPVFGHGAGLPSRVAESTEPLLMLLSVAAAAVGIGLGFWIYGRRPVAAPGEAPAATGLQRLLKNKWYVDEIYDATILAAVRFLASRVSLGFIDGRVIEGTLSVASTGAMALGRGARALQSGRVRLYLASLATGAVVLLLWAVQ